MTEEIKRIIDYLKRSDKNKFGFEQGKLIDYEEAQLLLDCITNLQQENESHKKEMNYYKKQYHNCKSRIDKALIYLGKCDWNDKHCFENLINILNESDEK